MLQPPRSSAMRAPAALPFVARRPQRDAGSSGQLLLRRVCAPVGRGEPGAAGGLRAALVPGREAPRLESTAEAPPPTLSPLARYRRHQPWPPPSESPPPRSPPPRSRPCGAASNMRRDRASPVPAQVAREEAGRQEEPQEVACGVRTRFLCYSHDAFTSRPAPKKATPKKPAAKSPKKPVKARVLRRSSSRHQSFSTHRRRPRRSRRRSLRPSPPPRSAPAASRPPFATRRRLPRAGRPRSRPRKPSRRPRRRAPPRNRPRRRRVPRRRRRSPRSPRPIHAQQGQLCRLAVPPLLPSATITTKFLWHTRVNAPYTGGGGRGGRAQRRDWGGNAPARA